MYRVFEKSGQVCNFSAESASNLRLFVDELAEFLHGFSQATASVIVELQANESGSTRYFWSKSVGTETNLIKPLETKPLVLAGVKLAIEKGIDTCLVRDTQTGQVTPISSFIAPRGKSPAKQLLQSPVKPRGNLGANPSALEKVAAGFVAPTSAEEKQHTQAQLNKIESVVWIRSLSRAHVMIAICPRVAMTQNLNYLIRNAQDARAAYRAKLQSELKYEDSRRVLRLAETVSEKLPLNEQAYLQANEIRRYLKCDRVTIFDINNSSATALAVSGQPKFNPRSNSIRAGQHMVGRIAKTGEPFWFEGNFDELADSLKHAVRRYTDESLVNSFAVLPLVEAQKPVFPSEEETMQEAISPGSASEHKTVGAVLVEQIEDVIDRRQIQSRWDGIKQLVLNQYANSRKFDSIFLVRLWTMLGRFAALYRGQTKRKAIATTSAIAAVVLGSLIIPADFKIRCEGYLVFDKTMELYSKGDGNVIELNVFDGKPVKRGDVLLIQENHEVAMESTKLTAEIAQRKEEIMDLNNSRTRSHFLPSDNESKSAEDLTQRVIQLEVELAQLEKQLNLVNGEMGQLKVTAPFDGVIAGWKTERRLLGRPLEKGTHLFSLIPEDAAFKLELRVPDQRAGYVQSAWHRCQENDKELPVVFRLASAPGENRKATVNFVSPALERDEHIGYSLPIYAMTDDEIPVSQRKSRTAVLAKVVCGRHSYAYCKSYEVIDWIRSKFFEYSF